MGTPFRTNHISCCFCVTTARDRNIHNGVKVIWMWSVISNKWPNWEFINHSMPFGWSCKLFFIVSTASFNKCLIVILHLKLTSSTFNFKLGAEISKSYIYIKSHINKIYFITKPNNINKIYNFINDK